MARQGPKDRRQDPLGRRLAERGTGRARRHANKSKCVRFKGTMRGAARKQSLLSGQQGFAAEQWALAYLAKSSKMIELSDTEIERLITPWIHAEVQADDPEWAAEARRLAAKATRNMRRDGLWKRLAGRVRGPAQVRKHYQDKIWPSFELAKRLAPDGGKHKQVVWGERRFWSEAMATKRVHLALLMKTIHAISPKKVLEVGSGIGINLLALGARFPDIEFFGAELTKAGVDATTAVAAKGVPENMISFSPEPIENEGPLDNVHAIEANATSLQFADGEFGFVFSAHALEQMEAIRESAMSEMVRVSSGHVAMIEPFADWNASGMRREFIVGKQYFQGSVGDLESLGLTVEFVTGNIPAKLTMGMGFVLARKA